MGSQRVGRNRATKQPQTSRLDILRLTPTAHVLIAAVSICSNPFLPPTSPLTSSLLVSEPRLALSAWYKVLVSEGFIRTSLWGCRHPTESAASTS